MSLYSIHRAMVGEELPATSPRWSRFRSRPELSVTVRGCTEVWLSKIYLVQVLVKPITFDGQEYPRTVLGIRRCDGAEIREKWDELQAIKDEIAGRDKLAVEIYPPSHRVVNVAPMRWLWIVPPGERVPMFGAGNEWCEW